MQCIILSGGNNINIALIGDNKTEELKILYGKNIVPTFIGNNLDYFVKHLFDKNITDDI